ncbi:uncharacterized protein LOC132628355 [Lycium barbarum]|uniref:uncharacterized protein LOC132628355 n=1 Tax=Lycium barbarum TaxID=112863 RepID=UPI00293EA814|nr:uncharacterized protein LOC132628355 [Lycium barbarum]
MEYLTRTLKNLQTHSTFKHYSRCKKLQLVQLSFADDLLLFSRGDIESIKALLECFQLFSKASGLVANVEKSSIYFGGVSNAEQLLIIRELGFAKGELPFKYLGVPLSTKRTTVFQYKPLVDKILERIQSWIARFLSYAGRIQLIKSVLFSVQIFWSQVFILPKKIVKVIESLCRKFLWIGSVEPSKKALIAWETLCLPKSACGLNLLDIQTWNKAAISKMLWNLCMKKDKKWIQWVHSYYIKGGSVWETQAKQASWIIRKILKANLTVAAAGYEEQDLIQMQQYSIKTMYLKLRGVYAKVHWRRLVCNNLGAPKWTFILYLAISRRLLTTDRLGKWGMIEDQKCPLYDDANETTDHLFFGCSYSTDVWKSLLIWQGISRSLMEWNEEIDWAVTNARGRAAGSILCRMILACGVYCIWAERNLRVFQTKTRPARDVIRQVIQDVYCKAYMKSSLHKKLSQLDFYPH